SGSTDRGELDSRIWDQWRRRYQASRTPALVYREFVPEPVRDEDRSDNTLPLVPGLAFPTLEDVNRGDDSVPSGPVGQAWRAMIQDGYTRCIPVYQPWLDPAVFAEEAGDLPNGWYLVNDPSAAYRVC